MLRVSGLNNQNTSAGGYKVGVDANFYILGIDSYAGKLTTSPMKVDKLESFSGV